jgi:NAD(P)-dependent dehydrogenase (short-subunit alcohol dehydrogenase family)
MPVDPDLRIQELATLRRIIEYGMARVAGAIGPMPAVETKPEPAPIVSDEPARYRRLTPIAATEDLNGHHAAKRLQRGARVLMTDDGLGLAPALAHLLGERGAEVIILTPNGLPSNGTSVRQCRLDQPKDVQNAVRSIKEELGGIDALIHLAGLSVPQATNPAAEEYSAALSGSVKSAFHLVKALHDDLKSGAAIAVTGLGGQFGFQPESSQSDAGIVGAGIGGGVAGFFKTVAREMPDAAVKVLDMEPGEVAEHPHEAAQQILDEMDRGTSALEVGYRQGQRFVVRLVESPVDRSSTSEVELGPDSVVLVIGGGRGVGATIAKELAARYQPIILSVGRSPLPREAEAIARQNTEQRQQWRREYHRRRREEHPELKPVEVEREIERLEAGAETWQTLHAIEESGGRADYRACDVRNASEVDVLVKEIYARFDRLDVVVFGAGIIEDKPIENKASASFDRVFDVKGLGYYHLWQALRDRPPALLVAFSSVAGRFGNRGQADYAAANDLLSRMTGAIRRTTPGLRAVAIDWTAWSEVGLAARSGATDFLAETGLEPLSPSDGARAFIDELQHGTASAVCIVRKLGAFEPEIETNGTPNGNGHAPVIGYLDQVVTLNPGVEISMQGQLDPIRDTWLNDHVIDGNTLLPGVMGIELMAEGAARLFPDWTVIGLEDLEISRAVKFFPDHPLTLTVSGQALPSTNPDERRAAMRITSDFASPNGRIRLPDRLHYTSTIILRKTFPNPPMIGPPPGTCDALVSRDSLYGPIGVLPHGPLFRVLKDLRMVGEGAFGYLWPLDEPALAAPSSVLQTTPLLCETAFQVAGLLALLRLNWPGLPASVKRLTLYGRPHGEALYATSRVAGYVDGVPGFDSDIASTDGRVFLRLEGFRIIGLDHKVETGE